MNVLAILNKDGGTLKTADLGALAEFVETSFHDKCKKIDVKVIDGDSLISVLDNASASKSVDMILIGGGDGTVSAAAGAAWKGGKALAVIPAGTMNLFAKALKLPLDIETAITLAAEGSIVEADIATANGRPFVHQISVGLQPRTVRLRDEMEYGSRYGKMLASVKSISSVVLNPPQFEVVMKLDGVQKPTGKLSALSISNNLFGHGHIPFAEKIDGNTLGVYCSERTNSPQTLKVIADILLGRWKENDQISVAKARKVSLQFPRKKSGSKMVIDGELIDLEMEVNIEILPKALRVVAPRHSSKNK